MCKIFIEDTNDNLNFWIEAASLECDLQIHCIVLAGKDDRTRILYIGSFQRTSLTCVCLNNRNAHVACGGSCVGTQFDFQHNHIFAHLLQPLCHTISQMSKPNQNDMLI